ncbi:hypothetical protein [Novosphingobium sp. LASN5T]|uniref:hypothetical protein n=1 Tax=Novosphingobium sp. LASN5T TaxID=2491021 RepID=UPI000F5DFFE8|nr:hypothetical protein [Novosphingobium sp. LASN5T]RQW44849.1 hypothetical protein EH199_06050 [Novosphingobium sp. LASN5T]
MSEPVATEAVHFHVDSMPALARLTFDPDRDSALTRAITAVLEAPLPAPTVPVATQAGGALLIWQGPHDFLIETPGALLPALEQAVAGKSALVGDAGAGLVSFTLSGSGVAARLDHDRPGPGLCSRVMRFAALRVTAVWRDDTVRLHVDRSHAAYVRQWLLDRWDAVEMPAS